MEGETRTTTATTTATTTTQGERLTRGRARPLWWWYLQSFSGSRD